MCATNEEYYVRITKDEKHICKPVGTIFVFHYEAADGSIPQPPSETTNGYRPPTQVEVYLDLACSDCALAWPVMSHVAEVYGNDAEFLYRLFPLPYHRNAFTAAKVKSI